MPRKEQTSVVFHIDEMDKWELVLRSAANLCKSVDLKMIKIRVVANSSAVKGYLKDNNSNAPELRNLNDKKIVFCACNNALKGLSLSKTKLFDFVKVVPVGVKELIERQEKGYAYIKP